MIGCATYRNITGDLLQDARLVRHGRPHVEIAGIDHVAIGTDFSHNFTQPDYDWMRKGRWTRGALRRRLSRAGPAAPPPDWFQKVGDLAKVPPALAKAGFDAVEVEKLSAGNWLRLYGEVFGAADQVKEARLEFVQSDPVLATTPRAAAT